MTLAQVQTAMRTVPLIVKLFNPLAGLDDSGSQQDLPWKVRNPDGSFSLAPGFIPAGRLARAAFLPGGQP